MQVLLLWIDLPKISDHAFKTNKMWWTRDQILHFYAIWNAFDLIDEILVFK